MSDTVNSPQSSNQVGGALTVGIICLVIGAALGYYTRYFMEQERGAASGPPASAAMGGPPPGGMGGMGGMGGGGMSQPGPSLARLVRNLAVIQKVQNSGITPAQAQTLKPILEEIKSAEKLPEADAKAKLDAINNALTPEQKSALEAMQPRRGGGGGPGGPGGGGAGAPTRPSVDRPMATGPSGMGGGPPGGGMGGGSQDPERPFASERNQQALDELISSLK